MKESQPKAKFQFSTRYHVLLLLFIAVLPVLGLIFYSDMEDRQDAHKLGRNQAMEVLRSIQLKQNNILESANLVLTALGQLPEIQSYDGKNCVSLLGAMLNQYTQYVSLSAFKPNGEIICSAPFNKLDHNIADQIYYQQATDHLEMVTSDYVIEPSFGRAVLHIVKPILNVDKKLHAIVTVGIDFNWLQELVLQLPLYDPSVLTVFNTNGTILVQYPSQKGSNIGDTYKNDEIVKTAVDLRHLGVIERADKNGTKYIHAYSPLGHEKSKTFISISIPTNAILAKANQTLQQNLIIAGIVTLTAILIAFGWSFRLIVTPIRQLAEAATQVRQGKLNTNLSDTKGPKELSELSWAFDQMTTALKRRSDDQERIEHALSQLIKHHRNTTSAEFLVSLTSILADSLNAKYCMIGLIDADKPDNIQTKVFWGNGNRLDNISFHVTNTPHQELIGKERFRIYRSKTKQMFPEDRLLDELEIESYAGITLTDFNQNIRGVLVVMNNQPITNDDMYHSLLQIFSVRVIAELEREQTELQRQQLLNEARLAATAFESQESMFITDAKRNILRVNRAFTAITGYSEEVIVGKQPCLLFSSYNYCIPCNEIWDEAKKRGKWSGEIELMCSNGKPFPADLTISAVENSAGEISHYVAHFQNITERKLAEARIQHLAYHDDLTELPNRVLLLDRLETTLSSLKRRNEFGALMFIDLDNFKDINDSLGHPIGDALLIGIAERLSKSLRGEDTVARLGGDEFVVLLPKLGKDKQHSTHEAHTLANKLLDIISQDYKVSGHTLKTSVSIGIVIFPESNLSANDILRHADLAMYSAKNAGRGSIQFFEPEMQARLIKRIKIEDELRTAYDKKQFLLYLQPQLEVKTNAIIGSEILLRWEHPNNGLTVPGEFINVLEECGLINSVGQWVLEQACMILADNKVLANHNHRPVIAVNISPRQFLDRDFVSSVTTLLDEYDIEGDRLELEITERAVIKDVEETISKMKQLKEYGVRFSIDDFGTGYSSLSYIKRLPIDTLKIDRSFIKDCLSDSNDKAIVRAIISMAQSLELSIIAEGVETQEQLEFLKQIGCQAYQGFYFSPAVSESEFNKMLLSSDKVP